VTAAPQNSRCRTTRRGSNGPPLMSRSSVPWMSSVHMVTFGDSSRICSRVRFTCAMGIDSPPHVSGDESHRLVGIVCREHTLAQGGPGPHDERSVETMGPIRRLRKVHDELGPGTSGEVRVSVDVDTAARRGGSAIAHGGCVDAQDAGAGGRSHAGVVRRGTAFHAALHHRTAAGPAHEAAPDWRVEERGPRDAAGAEGRPGYAARARIAQGNPAAAIATTVEVAARIAVRALQWGPDDRPTPGRKGAGRRHGHREQQHRHRDHAHGHRAGHYQESPGAGIVPSGLPRPAGAPASRRPGPPSPAPPRTGPGEGAPRRAGACPRSGRRRGGPVDSVQTSGRPVVEIWARPSSHRWCHFKSPRRSGTRPRLAMTPRWVSSVVTRVPSATGSSSQPW
jgi:hypothetical protein